MTCDVNKRDKLFPKSVVAKKCFHTSENKGATLPMEIPPTTSDWVKSTSVKRIFIHIWYGAADRLHFPGVESCLERLCPKRLFWWPWCPLQVYRISFAYDKFTTFVAHRDLTFGGHFATPVLSTGKQQKWFGCIDRPHMHAKRHWNPSTLRHSNCCDQLCTSAAILPRLFWGRVLPQETFFWSWCSPQVCRFSFSYDKF